ncbi:MAG: penicillin-binding protein 2 [Acidobacteria bacterium]|nr:MAG: penicillin-binding protein 2 [Acidobacteriota bacterium]PYQ86518.1 MAG: penicillin-binding protein 2 [Acidobacteriota bacterium]PYQ91554.1 MAG: penicillin-binding protein 2 [Acidobacteriota bacterium]PYR08802.1 MAG: penicillin-binding protein 2 [Acidobacteriota bacterium]
MTIERRGIGMRLSILQYVITVIFSILAVSFWVLQVVEHAQFEEMAENNHQRTLALRAPRGIVFDREGKVLVENRHSYSISIVREHTKDLNRTIRLLAGVLGMDEPGVRTIVERHRREPTYRPITIVQDATLAQVSAVKARRLDFELPDVVVEEVPTRQYPETMAAHAFGYVGEVNDAQVAAGEEGLKSGDIVGQSGIEKVYNAMLMGEDGAKRVVVNSVGREIRTLEEDPPTEGKRLQLTIDYDLQKAVEDAFDATEAAGLTNAGAAIVLDPNTGGILAFASRPAYDPNAFAAGIDRATWASLNIDEDRPLNDRAIQGRYSPGSTFKMAVALAGLEEGIITPDFHAHCAGAATFYGRPFKCWKKGGHGSIDLRHAIEQSCDVYFYTVANMVGVDKINKWATALGLGVKSGIDLPNENQGLVPSTEWKMRVRHEKWYAGETISVGIGQGQVSVTPVSMAVYMATLANGGTRVTPHLLKAVDDGTGWKPVPGPAPQSKVEINPEKLQAIRDGLWMVVNSAGTGATARIAGKDVSGKTGSAQVISNAGRAAARTSKDLRDNGWFVFFAPRDHPTVAGVVFLEHGIHGPNAARVAHHILDTFFAKQDGRPLPPPPTKESLRFDFSDAMAKKQSPPVEPTER